MWPRPSSHGSDRRATAVRLRLGGRQACGLTTPLTKILPQLETEIVKRSNRTKGFVVLPRRWTVERTFAPLLG
jgi:transposase